MHSAKELKKTLIEAVEKKSCREIQATKFICEFNPKSQANIDPHVNLCFLARTSNELCIAIIMNVEGETSWLTQIMCLDSKRVMMCGRTKEGQHRAGYFLFEELDLKCEMREGALGIDVKLKRNRGAITTALHEIFQVNSLNSLPTLHYY